MKQIRIPTIPRIMISILISGVFMLCGLLYLSWHSLDEEHRTVAVSAEKPVVPTTDSTNASTNATRSATPNASVSPERKMSEAWVGADSAVSTITNSTPASQQGGAPRTGSPTGGGEVMNPDESTEEVALSPVLPAIFNAADNPNLTNIPTEGMEGIAEEFVEKVKQGGWDTTSEAYRKNWEKATEEADELFKAKYGYDAYLKLHRGDAK